MRKSISALVATTWVGLASTAMAASIAPLTTGGRTLAGPGKTTMAASGAALVYSQVATSTDVCATVINSSRSSTVRVALVGPALATVTFDVVKGTAATLCHDNVQRVELVCLAADSACATQWRIDEN